MGVPEPGIQLAVGEFFQSLAGLEAIRSQFQGGGQRIQCLTEFFHRTLAGLCGRIHAGTIQNLVE